MAVPLTAEEIDEALDALRLKHPAKADFVPPATSVTTEPSGDVKTVEYSALPAEEIAAYRDARYAQANAADAAFERLSVRPPLGGR